MRQAARTVAEQNIKTVDASVRGQSAFDHAAVRKRINVAAGEQQHHFAAGEFRQMPGQHRGQSRSARAFDNALFQFREPQHRERERFLLNLNHLMHQRFRNRERLPACFSRRPLMR